MRTLAVSQRVTPELPRLLRLMRRVSLGIVEYMTSTLRRLAPRGAYFRRPHLRRGIADPSVRLTMGDAVSKAIRFKRPKHNGVNAHIRHSTVLMATQMLIHM